MFRWLALSVLAACLGISAFFRHRARQEGETIPRRREKPLFIILRIVFTLPLLGSILAYLIHPPWMLWSSFDAPLWLRWVGVGLGVIAVPMVYWVFRSIGGNISETVLTKEHHELVTDGPYSWIRHPLYTTGIGLILSIGLMAANGFILLLDAVVLVLIRFMVIPAEERALLATFGDRYRDYMKQTGRLLPKL